MSISVTVSGEDSTSVILSSVLTESVSISEDSSVDVVASSGNSATITVSSGDPISITGNYSNFVTGQVVRPPEIADFLTENQINTKITTATGDYNTLAANTFYLKSNPSGYITGVDLSELEAATGNLDTRVNSNTANIVTANENIGAVGLSVDVNTSDIATNAANIITANEGIEANTSSIEDNSDAIADNTDNISNLTGVTGNFITDSETGLFYASSNPSGFITGVDLSSYVQDSETGLFLVSGEDASISSLQVGSTPAFPYTRTVKLHDDGVQFGARLALIGTTDNGFPGLEMVTDGDTSKRTLIRHEGEGSNDYGISFFTTNNGVVAEKVRFDGDGNVGIGTDTPSGKLHIAGSAQNSYIEPIVENTAAIGAAGFSFINSNQEWKMGVNIADTFRIRDHDASTNPFVIEAGGAPNDSFHMDSNGNVGIGTATPDQLLHINRNQNAATNIKIENSNAGVNSSAGMNFHSATADGYYFLHGANRTTSRYGLSLADWVELTHGGSDDLNGIVIGTRTDIPVVIGANNNEIARFTDNGVGIGTTTPDELLHLEATSQSATREVLMKATVSDAGNDQFGISNGTSTNSNFAPSFYGYKDSNYGNGYIYSMNFRGLVPSSQDTTQTNRFGIIHFETLKSSSATDPNNSLDGGVSNRKVLTVANGSDTLVNIEANGNVGIGTTTPSEKLEVSGNLMLQQNGVIKNKNNNTQFRFDPNDFYFDSGHVRAGYSVGVRGNKGSQKGMDQGSTTSDLGLYCGSNEAISIDTNGNVNANYNLIVNQDLSVSGESSFSSRPTVNGTGVLLSGEGGGGGTVENVVHTTGDQTISGTKSFGKISLSENSFVTETGSFTIGPTHRGATVLLENPASMTVTIPAQVSGHTTTFIAETSNSVVFATGAGISGFNSFNSANQIAGIYGQAQIIFKSPEYAFLGGNVV